MPKLKPLNIWRCGKEPSWYRKRPDEQTIRERAEFLAHEIFADRLAPEDEIADAIETEILRFTMKIVTACPRCGSARIQRTDYVHCFACATATTLPLPAAPHGADTPGQGKA